LGLNALRLDVPVFPEVRLGLRSDGQEQGDHFRWPQGWRDATALLKKGPSRFTALNPVFKMSRLSRSVTFVTITSLLLI
jgi:hypothetical protein